MAQAAQREPSMEEILASIRRIIENNDPPNSAQTFDADVDLIETSHDHSFAVGPSTNDYEAAAGAPLEPTSRPQSSIPPVHQDEVSSQGVDQTTFQEPRAASAPELAPDPAMARVPVGERSVPAAPLQSSTPPRQNSAPEIALSQSSPAQAVHTQSAPHQAAGPVSLADVAARIRSGSSPAAQSHQIDYEAMERDAAEELRDALMSDEILSASANQPTNNNSRPNNVQAAGATAQPAGQLISAGPGEKVAAAFEQLSVAIEEGSRRSFDEIAEDMLRPMLQSWLDDNLPTMVERLVREEIERVSRGNRR